MFGANYYHLNHYQLKTILSICVLILCSLATLPLSAQKTAKLYAKIQKAQDKKEYYDMIDLLEKLPKEEKTLELYNKLMAISLDSVHRPVAAIPYYTQYITLTHDSAATQRLAVIKLNEEKRIAAWKAKLIRIKDCPKCHGTDTTYEEVLCTPCAGNGQVRKTCSRCQGQGKISCPTCMGKGTIESPNGPVTCGTCQGNRTQQCSTCDYHGYTIESCHSCNGSGKKMAAFKCDKHD
jgi:hypothetical protein